MFSTESGRCGLQEVEMLAEIERYNDDDERKDVLNKQEDHTYMYRLTVGTDVTYGSDGCAVVVSDVRIDGCQ